MSFIKGEWHTGGGHFLSIISGLSFGNARSLSIVMDSTV